MACAAKTETGTPSDVKSINSQRPARRLCYRIWSIWITSHCVPCKQIATSVWRTHWTYSMIHRMVKDRT